MKIKVACLCVWIGILGGAATTNAALITTSNFNPTLNGSGQYTIGNLIQIGSTPITINALGVQDTGANGIIGTVPVGIWNSTGTTLLASATVPTGTAGILLNDYRYVLLGSPLTLAASTQYLIGALSASSPAGTREIAGEGNPGSIYFGDTGVTILASRYNLGGGPTLTAPTTLGGSGAAVGRWGHANATFVPEPTSFVMLLFGSVMLGIVRRQRSR